MKTESPSAEMAILLAHAGGWLVGVDARHVRGIAKFDGPVSGAFELARLLGFPLREVSSPVQRALVVARASSVRHLLVDNVVGTVRLHSLSAKRLPTIFERSGVPPWWLGIAVHDGQVVLLIDLPGVLDGFETEVFPWPTN